MRDQSLAERLGSCRAATTVASFNVPRIPLRLPAHVEHLQFSHVHVARAATCALSSPTLICAMVASGKPRLLPRRDASIQVSARTLRCQRARGERELPPPAASLFRDQHGARPTVPAPLPAHDANCPDSAMLTDPGTCPAANASPATHIQRDCSTRSTSLCSSAG
jgi:hypothetical protein